MAEVAKAYSKEYAAWLSGDISLQMPDGESVNNAVERIRAFIDCVQARHAGDVVAIVTHKILCQMATCLLLGLPVASFQRVRHDNAGVSVFRWRTDRSYSNGSACTMTRAHV